LEDKNATNIYVSWNGDTRTKSWRFYEVLAGRRSFIGEVARKSFETVLTVERIGVKNIQAEALDVEGTVLVDTSAVKPEVMIHKYEGKGKKAQSGLVPWLTFKGQKFFKSKDL
jgi:hypothetical protein